MKPSEKVISVHPFSATKARKSIQKKEEMEYGRNRGSRREERGREFPEKGVPRMVTKREFKIKVCSLCLSSLTCEGRN